MSCTFVYRITAQFFYIFLPPEAPPTRRHAPAFLAFDASPSAPVTRPPRRRIPGREQVSGRSAGTTRATVVPKPMRWCGCEGLARCRSHKSEAPSEIATATLISESRLYLTLLDERMSTGKPVNVAVNVGAPCVDRIRLWHHTELKEKFPKRMPASRDLVGKTIRVPHRNRAPGSDGCSVR